MTTTRLTLRESAQKAYRQAPPDKKFIAIYRHAKDERDPQFVGFREIPTAEVLEDVGKNYVGFELAKILDLGVPFEQQWPADGIPESPRPASVHPMEALLEHLLATRCPERATANGSAVNAATDPPAFEGQITLVASGTMAGSIARGPVPGTYRMLSVAQIKDPKSGKVGLTFVESYFTAAAISNVSVERADLKDNLQGVGVPGESRLIVPRS